MSNETSLSAIERIALARTREDLAQEIEPLAQSMAALADDLRQVMDETKGHTEELTATTAQAWTDAASSMKTAAVALKEAAEQGQRAALSLQLRMWLLVILVALVCSVAAPTGYWIWQRHYGDLGEKAHRWDVFLQDFGKLQEKDRRTITKLLGWEK